MISAPSLILPLLEVRVRFPSPPPLESILVETVMSLVAEMVTSEPFSAVTSVDTPTTSSLPAPGVNGLAKLSPFRFSLPS